MKTFFILTRNCSLTLAFLFFTVFVSNAQMVGPNSYLKATNVEIGLDGAGGFEGCNTTTSSPPAGMHFRSGTSYFGFVANPQLDGWANFNGDFFCPGSPENGWGLQLGNVIASAASNNCAGFPQVEIPGGITGYSHTGSCYNVDYSGNMTTGGTNLGVKINYNLQETDLYYTTTVSIKNNTSATIPELYYYRNLDPDNNEPISFDFSTQNTIISEPTTACGLAHVSATQAAGAGVSASYLGLAAVGGNFRVCYGGFSNRYGYDLWTGGVTGSGTFTETVGSTNFADEAISLSYKISNLAPGATETFRFVVILDAASATNAINNLLSFSYTGAIGAPPSVCTPYTDTARTCGNPVAIGITGSVVGDFTWSWSPTAGLTPATGPTVVANPASTTLYTATGTPTSGCLSPVNMQIWVQVTPSTGADPVISPNTPSGVPLSNICLTTPVFNLVVDSAGGTWAGPGITDPALGTFNPAIAGIGSYIISYIRPGVCNNADTVIINVNDIYSAHITQPAPVCTGSAPFNLVAANPGGTWSGPGITNVAAGTFDLVSAGGPGTYIVSYVIGGMCGDNDSVIVTVKQTADATINQPPPMCIGTAPMNLTAAQTGGAWSGTGITNAALGTFSPAVAGVGAHIITYSLANPCGDVDTVIATVFAIANASITAVNPVCINATPFNLTTATAGGIFSGTGITDSVAGIFSPAIAGAGVHTITYTISGLCGASGTTAITVIAMPVISFTSDTTEGCEPTIITYTGTSNQPGGTCAWVFGNGHTSTLCSDTTRYIYAGNYDVSYTYTNTTGCSTSVTQTGYITIHPQPVAAFSVNPQPANMLNPVIRFTDQSFGLSPIVSWNWDFQAVGTSSLQNPVITYPDTGIYNVQLIITNIYGCLDTANEQAIIDPLYMFYAPNAFTPNSNGNNDEFRVYGDGIDPDHFQMAIYDRWGERIFKTTNLFEGWNGAKNNNGQLVEQGVYVYKVDLKDYGGTSHQYIGNVTVVR